MGFFSSGVVHALYYSRNEKNAYIFYGVPLVLRELKKKKKGPNLILGIQNLSLLSSTLRFSFLTLCFLGKSLKHSIHVCLQFHTRNMAMMSFCSGFYLTMENEIKAMPDR